jgi:formate dehydrogenase major subunit
LQAQAGNVGLREVRYGYAGANHLEAPTDASNPYFTFESSKCIVCSRCVRACEEVQGTFALTILGRGFDSKVSPGGADFLSSECVSAALRASVPYRASSTAGHREGDAGAHGPTTCALLRRRLFLQGGAGDEVLRMVS